MKKVMIGLLTLLPIAHVALARGGDAVAAGIAAGMFTGIATSAIVNGSSRSNAEEEARRAREEAQLLRREYQQDKIDQIRREVDNRDVVRKDEELRRLEAHFKSVEQQHKFSQGGLLFWTLLGVVGILLAVLLGMGAVMLRHRHK